MFICILYFKKVSFPFLYVSLYKQISEYKIHLLVQILLQEYH